MLRVWRRLLRRARIIVSDRPRSPPRVSDPIIRNVWTADPAWTRTVGAAGATGVTGVTGAVGTLGAGAFLMMAGAVAATGAWATGTGRGRVFSTLPAAATAGAFFPDENRSTSPCA